MEVRFLHLQHTNRSSDNGHGLPGRIGDINEAQIPAARKRVSNELATSSLLSWGSSAENSVLRGHQKIHATADTGSELDLLSAAYARRRGYGVQLIPASEMNTVQFADESITRLLGRVEAKISFSSSKKYNQTFYVL
jgi:hypothetical protein